MKLYIDKSYIGPDEVKKIIDETLAQMETLEVENERLENENARLREELKKVRDNTDVRKDEHISKAASL